MEAWTPARGPLWVHVDRASERVREWLNAREDLPKLVRTVLLAEETRPRVFTADSGVVAILRGINLNAGAEPDDMVAVRLWADQHRVITVRQRRLMTPRDILSDLIERRAGPTSAPVLFAELAGRLTQRMNSVIIELDEQLDGIEERLEDGDFASLRRELTDLRQSCVSLRRYIGPQREALARLQIDRPAWLDHDLQNGIRESADQLQRYIEDLDSARDRAVVIRDEIANRLSEGMNCTMYALTIVAAIFLPISFLTGLLGVNVGGMPGVDSGDAFWIICGLLVVVIVAEVILFRRLKWL